MLRWLAVGGLMLGACPPMAHALDGDADPTFGINGQVTITRPNLKFPATTAPTGDLALLPDGRYLWAQPLGDGSLWVGRAFRDGSPDTGFGSDSSGRVTLTACTALRAANLVANADGGAVVWTGACLLRLTANGSIDATFGAGPQPPAGLRSGGLVRDSSGRFVLAGSSAQNWLVYRFDANGVADATFGTAGAVEVNVPATNNVRELRTVSVRSDGHILTAGSRGNTHGPNLVVVQLQEDGSLDPAWNANGIVDITAPNGFSSAYANAIAVDEDGSLVVSGMGSNGVVNCCMLLARFDTAGQLVPSFGLRLFQLAGAPNLFPFFEQRDGLALLPNHRIMMATISFPFTAPFGHRTQYTLVRTFADGEVDASFGHGGWNSFTIADPVAAGQTGDYEQGHAIAYERDSDSMLIFGRTFFEDNSTGDDYVSLVRSRFDLIFADGVDR
ncbi:MAG: hypothetical protein ABIO49_12455 [Dokdonella sp.]